MRKSPGLGERGLAPVDEEARAQHGGVSSSRAVGHARADGVDVRAGREPLAERATGSRDDVTVQTMSAPVDGLRDRRRTGSIAMPWRLRLALGERLRALERLARDADAAELADGEHRLEVRARLDARADEREVAGVLAGEQPRREAAHGGRADRGDRRRVDDREQAPAFRLEEQDRALVRVELGALVARKERDGLERRALRARRGAPASGRGRPTGPASQTIWRSGSIASPRASAAKARAITSMHSFIGKKPRDLGLVDDEGLDHGTSAGLPTGTGWSGRISRGRPATASGRSSGRRAKRHDAPGREDRELRPRSPAGSGPRASRRAARC